MAALVVFQTEWQNIRAIGLTMQDVYDITQKKIDLLRDLRGYTVVEQ